MKESVTLLNAECYTVAWIKIIKIIIKENLGGWIDRVATHPLEYEIVPYLTIKLCISF